MRKSFVVLFICAVLFVSAVTLREKTADGYFQIAEKMGYTDVEKTPYEVVKFTIPETFTPVYDRYNRLLEQSGYSLVPYRGKECTRYTYLIPSANARANIIVYDGKVIGGDISGITIDGVMIPIIKE